MQLKKLFKYKTYKSLLKIKTTLLLQVSASNRPEPTNLGLNQAIKAKTKHYAASVVLNIKKISVEFFDDFALIMSVDSKYEVKKYAMGQKCSQMQSSK